jgi:hypothetical protein
MRKNNLNKDITTIPVDINNFGRHRTKYLPQAEIWNGLNKGYHPLTGVVTLTPITDPNKRKED